MPPNPIDGKYTLVRVMTLYCQTTSHYLSQHWPRLSCNKLTHLDLRQPTVQVFNKRKFADFQTALWSTWDWNSCKQEQFLVAVGNWAHGVTVNMSSAKFPPFWGFSELKVNMANMSLSSGKLHQFVYPRCHAGKMTHIKTTIAFFLLPLKSNLQSHLKWQVDHYSMVKNN